MELKNIHSRKDYKKVYEFIGGTTGGVGEKDGFANNAKLKDTYLGKLADGIFKGIGWLWKKSKENFMINKLIAQLINELMRAVILFSFDNNIDLKEGKIKSSENAEGTEPATTTTTTTTTVSGVISASGVTTANTGVTTGASTTISGGTLLERIERVKTIPEFEIIKKEAEGVIAKNKVEDKKIFNTIAAYNRQLDIVTDKARVANLNKQIEKLNNKSEELKKYNQDIQNALDKKEKELGVQKATADFATIAKNCKDKYDFESKIPESSFSGDYDIFGAFAYDVYTKSFQRYKPAFIQIDDEFTVLDKNGKTYDIKIHDVNVKTGKVSYMNGGNEVWTSSNVLLPSGFPSFKEIKDQLNPFLSSHIEDYNSNSMNDKEKYRMELIYMNLVQIKDMSEYEKLTIESIEYITEDRSVGSTGGMTKIKTDEPRAGKVGVAKAIGMKFGVQANVGNILTKRDRQKYKENNGDEYGISISDVNLAEIEKTFQSMDNSSVTDSSGNTISTSDNTSTKSKVTSYVNPYNLKMIQLSAEKLLLPVKGDESNSKELLKIRWKKEVNKVYAAFHYLIDFEKIDITKDINEYMFGGKMLNKNKVEKKVTANSTNLSGQQKNAELLAKLPLDPNLMNWKSLGGSWAIFNFLYPRNSVSYSTSIAPVESVKDDFLLVNVASCFSQFDETTFTITENIDLTNKFTSGQFGTLTPTSKKIYLLMKKDQKAPTTANNSYPANVFIIIEIVANNNQIYTFIRKNATAQRNVPFTDGLLKTFNKAEYIHSIDQLSINKFTVPMDDKYKKAFKFSDVKGVGFNNFLGSNEPGFLTATPNMKQNLKTISTQL